MTKTTLVRVKIKGISPMLMNRMDDETIRGLITGKRMPIDKDAPFEEVCRKKVYREDGDKGAVGIPTNNLLSSLVEAGRRVKNGKKQISTAKTTDVFSIMCISETFLRFTNLKEGDEGWVVDRRRAVLHDKGKDTAVGALRPKFNAWEFELTIEVDETEVKPDVIRQLIETAGKKVGLCDFRPAKRGPFGRFTIASWEVMENAESVKDAA